MNVKLFIKSGLMAGLIAASGISHADFIGIYVDANAWQYKGPIQITDKGKTFSTDREFEIDKTSKMSASVRFEHPVPILPNVRVRYTPISFYTQNSQNLLNGTGATLVGNASMSGDFDTYDATLYYELLDNVVSVDVGVNAKQIKGEAIEKDLATSLLNALTGQQKGKATLSTIVPMAYLAAQVSIPTTKLSVGAEVSGISYDGSKVSDASAEIKYKFIDNLAFDLGAKLGYRQIKLLLDDVDNINADATLKGAYAGLEAHF